MVFVSSTVHNSHNALQVTNLMLKEIIDVVVGLTVEKEVNLVDFVETVCFTKLDDEAELDEEALETNKRFV